MTVIVRKNTCLTVAKIQSLAAHNLDIACAEALRMKFKVVGGAVRAQLGDASAEYIFAPSSDTRQAWRLVHHASSTHWARVQTPFAPTDADGGKHYAGFTPHGVTGWNGRMDYEASGDTPEEAICRAFLLLVNDLTTL